MPFIRSYRKLISFVGEFFVFYFVILCLRKVSQVADGMQQNESTRVVLFNQFIKFLNIYWCNLNYDIEIKCEFVRKINFKF